MEKQKKFVYKVDYRYKNKEDELWLCGCNNIFAAKKRAESFIKMGFEILNVSLDLFFGSTHVGYKLADSQGEYIDELRRKYPFKIHTRGYDACLVGIQPLFDGQEIPIYRFPGGDTLVGETELNKVVEW